MRFSHVIIAAAVVFALAGCTVEAAPTPTPSPSPTVAAPTTPIVDGGARDGASGRALKNSEGDIVRYFVASGDSASVILERFGLDLLVQLVNEDGKELRSDTVIYAQETLTLVPNLDLVGTLRVLDGGPINGAMGPVTLDDKGRPLTYTVVNGDSADLIRKRFDIWWDQLADDEGLRLSKYPNLFVGQVLTFTGSRVAFEEERP